MPQIPFIGGSGEGRSTNLDASRSINFMPELANQDSKLPVALVSTPGVAVFCEFLSGTVRMSYTFAGRSFHVSGDTLYEVFSDMSFSICGTFAESTGNISVADNGIEAIGVGGNQMMMVTNDKGYIYNIATGVLEQITDIGFPTTPKQVAYIDGYFIVTNDTMSAWSSELYNGLVWPGLAFASVISSPDVIKKPVNIHQQLFFIKEYVTEIWYDAAIPTSQGFPFVRNPGGVIDFGTSAPWSVVRGHNGLFFLANQRSGDSGEFIGVAMFDGNVPSLISSPAINYRISRMTTIDDAIGYCYSDEGHQFYVLTFPTEDVTLVYDLSMKMWHERSSYTVAPYNVKRHLSNTYTNFAGKHLVGDCTSGKLYEMSTKYYDEDGEPIVRIRTGSILYDNDNRFQITKFLIDAETGVGDGSVAPKDMFYAWIANGDHYADGTGVPGDALPQFDTDWPYLTDADYMSTWGTAHLYDDTAKAGGFDLVLSHNGDPQAWLSWSNDGGRTWSSEYSASLGKQGEYRTRLIWRRIGSPRNRIFKVRIVDSVKVVLLGAYVND